MWSIRDNRAFAEIILHLANQDLRRSARQPIGPGHFLSPLKMVVHEFPWDASTSVADLTEKQLVQLCSIIANESNSVVNFVNTALEQSAASTSSPATPGAQGEKPAPILVWSIGLLFVTFINMCAVVGIGVMRYFSKNAYNQIITLFVGLGVGSLSGSSLYHLIPQAHPGLLEDRDSNGQKTYAYLHMAHFMIIGVYAFFFCDKIIKIVIEYRKRNRSLNEHKVLSENGGAPSGRSDAVLISHNEHDHTEDVLRSVVQKGVVIHDDCHETEMMAVESRSGKSMGDQAHGICVHDHSMQFRTGDSAIAAVAWMIIFGDGLHNFIDGISIGASFSDSIHSGLSVSLAVLCEEFPHELGDVAILVASGMTLSQALLYNLLSAITCYIGFIIGVAIGELQVAKYAFALAGGMFLYISLACMMPEMRKAMEEALNVSIWHGVYVLFVQSVGLFSGLTLMYVMGRYGESLDISGIF
ncbi:unnamed protein product [Caenorhabditis auriculariae]|uniref:Zinc transporter ZIP14 n=1 Tax=Caenorhabditis auriculariae TaxID=2777116 RepID=A0A8S1HDI9_9PELO|nr:unnamed protein product [Caenorhabditis auriculariae]